MRAATDARILQCHIPDLVLDASSACEREKCAEGDSTGSTILCELARHGVGSQSVLVTALLIRRLPNFQPDSCLQQFRSVSFYDSDRAPGASLYIFKR